MNLTKIFITFSLVNSFILSVFSQAKAEFKFDFGSGKVAKGYTQIVSKSYYSTEKGYGFMPNSKVEGVNRKAKNKLTADFCTSKEPFFFTVDVPEGNYNVKIVLGDAEGESNTTVKVENRRLMLEKISTKKGEFLTKIFTVNVKNPQINATDKVKLKPRELNYLHWDNQLTFEFSDASPKICGLEITKAAENITTIFLAGNSTVVDQAQEPYAAWGQMIPRFFKAEKVVFANHAESGETIKSFVSEKRFDKIMSQIKAGDYLFIEFAHNDQKANSGVEANSTYKEYLRIYIQKVREKGATPVLVTSMYRRNFDSAGKLVNTLGDFPEAMRQTAKDENVALIDLNAMSKTLFEALGVEDSKKAFVHYAANTFPSQDKEIHDDTHFSNYGAYQLAKCMVEGIRNLKLGISTHILEELPTFDPAKPDSLESWSFPHSPLVNVIKPDGN